MAKFMLLLHDDPKSFEHFSPEDLQNLIAEYTAWRRDLESSGTLAGGEKLQDEGGKHLSRVDSKVRVLDGPFSEAKEVLGGYFLIEAADYDEAVEISMSCPHLTHGLRIELRQIEELG